MITSSDLIIEYKATVLLYIPLSSPTISNNNITNLINEEINKHKNLYISPIIETCQLYNNENFTLIASINDTIEIDRGYLNELETIPSLIKSDIINKYGDEDMIDVNEFDIDDWKIIN